nr:hypothetical protein [Clostridium sp. Marseille-P7770]
MPAKKETVAVEATETTETTESCTGATDDMVEIEIFKDSDRYKDDVVVALNGKVYVIKRGVRVRVPRAIKEILDHSREQDQQTALMTEEMESDFQEKSEKYK